VRIEGRERVAVERREVWRRLNDPAVLRRCTPGLVSLEPSGTDRFDAELVLELPALRGSFKGSVEYAERREPERLRLRLRGKGAPGFLDGEATLELAPHAEGTEVAYAADVQIGGPIARLGQRMISGVAKEMAGQFFERFALEQGAAGSAPAAPPSAWRALLQLAWRTLLRWLGLSRRGE
jgi:carbon monoxide dehydrogenase subunit G